MPTIHDLLQEAAAALAAKQAAHAAAVGTKTAIAAAAEAAAGGAGEGGTATQQAAVAGNGAGSGENDEAAAATAAAAAAAAAEAATPAAAAPAAAQGLDVLVTKLTDMSISNAKLSSELEAMTLSCAAMITVVSDSLDRMSIALGGGKVDVSKLTPEALVGMHAEHAARFSAKFPVGGVAAVNVDLEKDQAAQAGNSEALALHAMRVAAAAGSIVAKK